MKRMRLIVTCLIVVSLVCSIICCAENQTYATPKPPVPRSAATTTETPVAVDASESEETSEKTIDYDLIENSPFYDYNKFDKDWNIQTHFRNDEKGLIISIAFSAVT